MSVDRRELFRIIGAGVVGSGAAAAQHQHPTPATPVGDYEPRVLSADAYRTLQRMLEVLLPADEHAPGAHEAGTARYIDTTLKYGDDNLRNLWIAGLKAVGSDLGAAKLEEATQRVTALAAKEMKPETEAERFFVIFKRTAIDAYYLSDAGRKSLGYTG
ncbi:MAG: gluconate 2-dehydrogenase subunit 3 family protein, partial [Bryobacteraceae bacterium]|nr:gluconate 2-dehydrogenase subunit 3 family protein [Bryobacteraceae bacterium]